jgi:phenylpyruvate tautomerase PptA (4-oxalocrotonate tautomerase family)
LLDLHRLPIELSKIIMPYVNIQIVQGVTRAQKAQLLGEVTDALVRILGKKPEHIKIDRTPQSWIRSQQTEFTLGISVKIIKIIYINL